MAHRLDRIGQEEKDEPPRVSERYRVVLKRLEPVGLVYLYPEVG